MKSITLLEKSYGSYKIVALKAFRNRLSRELEGLEVQIAKISNNPSDWIVVELEGADEEAAFNLLRHNYGTTCSFEELKINQIRKGKLVQTGKYGFGIFIDIGIDIGKHIDALLPLHTFRQQLAKDEKISLRELLYAYGFLDYFPLELSLDSIDRSKEKIQVSLSENQLTLVREWVQSNLERLFVCGIPRNHLKKAIIQTGHLHDIVAIERIGLLEEMVLCKFGTTARGLLTEIGPLLKNAEVQLFIPATVKKFLL